MEINVQLMEINVQKRAKRDILMGINVQLMIINV